MPFYVTQACTFARPTFQIQGSIRKEKSCLAVLVCCPGDTECSGKISSRPLINKKKCSVAMQIFISRDRQEHAIK